MYKSLSCAIHMLNSTKTPYVENVNHKLNGDHFKYCFMLFALPKVQLSL